MGERSREQTVEAVEDGLRLDKFIAGRLEDVSRSLIQNAIKTGDVTVNTAVVRKPSRTVTEGDVVRIELPPEPVTDLLPEAIPLDILFEDAHILVVNKPAGLVVHPAPGHASGTLVNAVLHHCPDFERPVSDTDELAYLRPGIVHRLDRDTSGVMVIAKTREAFQDLARQARAHEFERQYVALVRGDFDADAGVIRAPLGRSLSDRKRMSVNAPRAREAVTHYRVCERFGVASFVELQLETGRTHQIRVHMRFVKHPVLGDPVYGMTDFAAWDVPHPVQEALENLRGQALHAERLGVVHPVTGEKMRFTAPLPEDFEAALRALRRYCSKISA